MAVLVWNTCLRIDKTEIFPKVALNPPISLFVSRQRNENREFMLIARTFKKEEKVDILAMRICL